MEDFGGNGRNCSRAGLKIEGGVNMDVTGEFSG